MARADITLRITRHSMPELLALGNNVLANMRNNPAYPEPRVPLDELEALLLRFRDLISLATDGSKQALLQRNACARELQEGLTLQAWYVRSKASGDAAALASSGFPLRKTPEPIGPLPAPQLVTARSGRVTGSVDLRWSPLKGAVSYHVFVSDDGTTDDWQLVKITGRVSATVSDLPSHTRHSFRVQAFGRSGMGPFSSTITVWAA